MSEGRGDDEDRMKGMKNGWTAGEGCDVGIPPGDKKTEMTKRLAQVVVRGRTGRV